MRKMKPGCRIGSVNLRVVILISMVQWEDTWAKTWRRGFWGRRGPGRSWLSPPWFQGTWWGETLCQGLGSGEGVIRLKTCRFIRLGPFTEPCHWPHSVLGGCTMPSQQSHSEREVGTRIESMRKLRLREAPWLSQVTQTQQSPGQNPDPSDLKFHALKISKFF